ncbi:MAG TPA: protein phosphatase 2C domain-containing protein [Chloroflexia bacterium]|nr:protein phosphatase 2C domain-containing protein [Chloroflexia bacterium]
MNQPAQANPATEIKTWVKSTPSGTHPERNEDAYWSARNGMAHAVIDGMGGSRRVVNGKEIGGEHAAAGLRATLDARLQDLPPTLSISAARELLSAVVAEAGANVYREVNASGQIPPEQIPEGKTAEDVMAAAVMTALIFCEGGRRAVVSQNGDTRCYLYSDNELILLTDDQDLVNLDLKEGKLTSEQAEEIEEELDTFTGFDIGKLDPTARPYFVQRNLVFGQIGDEPEPQSPAFCTIQLRPDDLLLLCSDGVYANLTTDEIAASMQSIDPAATLVDRSNARSSDRALPDPNDPSAPYNYRAHQDDTTALVVRVVDRTS